MSSNKLVLKIKTSFKDDIRSFRGEFKDLKEAFSKLSLYIQNAYGFNNLSNIIMQYKDDENDMVTIANELDLEDAMDQAKISGKCTKVFIKKKKGAKKAQSPKNSPKIKKEKVEKKEQSNADNNNHQNDENNGITGDLCKDICNNDVFRKEFISFLSDILSMYQASMKNNNNNGQNMRLNECISVALSKHSMMNNHAGIKQILSQINMRLPQMEMLVQPILSVFKVDKIAEYVNKFVECKKNGINKFQLMQMMGPLVMFNGLFDTNVPTTVTVAKNCPKNHGLFFFYTPHDNYYCDECQQKMPKHSPLYGCRICDYDLCSNCKNNNNNTFHFPSNGMFQSSCMYMGPGGMFMNNTPNFGRAYNHGHGRRHGRRCGGHGGRRHYMNNYNNINNNSNNNNNNNNSKDNEKKSYIANMIENPMPVVSGVVDPDQGIIKTWKMKNAGSLPLPKGLLIKYSGRRNNPMVSSEMFSIGNNNEIMPGEVFTVQVCVKTPQVYGRYSSNWRLCTPDGKKFGQKLPFYLVLSPPKNDNNNNNNNNEKEEKPKEVIEKKEEIDEAKMEEALNESEIDELTDKIVEMVVKESKLEDEIKQKEAELKLKEDSNNNSNNVNDNDKDVNMPVPDEIEEDDMVINDSDEEDSGIMVEEEIEKQEDLEEKIVIKKEEMKIEEDQKPKEVKKPEPKIEVYQYQAQLDQIKSMGFGNDDEVLRALLNQNQGRIDAAVNYLLNQ